MSPSAPFLAVFELNRHPVSVLQKENTLRFVVYAFPYGKDAGGNIALLLLCERLRELGFEAYIWPATTPYSLIPRSLKGVGKTLRRLMHVMTGHSFPTGPFSVPFATREMLEDAVIVYPEIVAGNPLRGKKVVRWFLHRPGHHTGKIDYGTDEAYFFYQDAFNDTSLNPDPDTRLTVTYLNPIYRNNGLEYRQGTCVLIRKGKDRLNEITLRGDLIIDGMPHESVSKAFNAHKFLQTLDPYSMYSVFAAMCGCIPVIEPIPGVSKQQWFPREEDRYGLAYGWDDVAWAAETQKLLLERLASDRRNEDLMVLSFAEKVKSRFSNG